MTKMCDITGVKVMTGNNVSHSKRRTKRDFLPNLKEVTFKSNALDSNFTLRVNANTLKTINKYGSFDSFLVNYRFSKLTELAKKIRHKIEKMLVKNNEFDNVKIVKKSTHRKVKNAKKSAKK